MKNIIKSISTLTLTLSAVLGPATALAHHYKVDGIYKMNVRIGERNFVDLVTLKEEDNHKLSGTVTVPGQFTATLTGSYGESENFSGMPAGNKIQFQIEAVENGQSIRVLYTGSIDPRSGEEGIFFQGHLYDQSAVFGSPNPAGAHFGTMEAVPLKALNIDENQPSFLH